MCVVLELVIVLLSACKVAMETQEVHRTKRETKGKKRTKKRRLGRKWRRKRWEEGEKKRKTVVFWSVPFI